MWRWHRCVKHSRIKWNQYSIMQSQSTSWVGLLRTTVEFKCAMNIFCSNTKLKNNKLNTHLNYRFSVIISLFCRLKANQHWPFCGFCCCISSLQEEAGSLLVDLSSSLNSISINQQSTDDVELVQAAAPIVEAASNILNVSSNVRTKLWHIMLDVIPTSTAVFTKQDVVCSP